MDSSLDARMQAYRDAGVQQVVLGLVDIDGVIRGKFVDLSKLESLMAHGGGFCDCILGWDVDDQLYEHGTYTGWQTGFPDVHYRLLTDTERTIPGERTPYFVGEFVDDISDFHPICPRSCLRRVLTRLGDLGYTVRSGFEYEFFIFKETPQSIREKGYRDLTPVTPGNFGYSVLRATTQSEAFNGLMDYCREFGFPLEGLHCETGPGVWEAALVASEGIDAADQAALFKNFTKVYFQKRGELATFMAKWSMDYPGQSGHYHFSLLDAEGRNAFSSEQPGGIPDIARYVLGGLMRYLPEWLPLLAPTVNSFTRLVRGAWAPTAASWGVENRTAAFRFIPGDASRQHVENRVGGADGNPYLAAAATLGAAALGIEEKIEPIAAVVGNAYEQEDMMGSEGRFSPTLRHAATRMGKSNAARVVFGDAFVEHFVGTRIWEAKESERFVNDWQLNRYLEII